MNGGDCMKRLKKKFAVLLLLSLFASVALFTTSASAAEVWVYEQGADGGYCYQLWYSNEYGSWPLPVYRWSTW